MKGCKRETGFTLMELLIVMAIISILAGLLLPAIATGRKKSLQARCVSNLKQLGLAVAMYVQDNDETLPDPKTDATGGNTAGEPTIYTLLFPYAKNKDIFYCLADPEGGKSGSDTEVTSYLWNYNKSGTKVSPDRVSQIPIMGEANDWHPGGSNVLFLDKHVRFANQAEYLALVAAAIE